MTTVLVFASLAGVLATAIARRVARHAVPYQLAVWIVLFVVFIGAGRITR